MTSPKPGEIYQRDGSPRLYYVQNLLAGYCGNSPMWWRDGGSGYTPRVNEAQKFTWSEVTQLKRSTRGTHKWKAWPVKLIDSITHLSVDFQDLPSVKRRNRKPKEPTA